MSKRSLGSTAAQKKGQKIHREERARHREKLRAKYDFYCASIEADYPDGTVVPSSFDVWQKFNKIMSQPAKEINVLPTQ